MIEERASEEKLVSYRLISKNGFGNGWNAYPHSMAWFKGELFVGVTRANLCMIKMHKAHTLKPWPIKCPKDVWEIKDRQVEIWAYNPLTGSWRMAYRAPMVLGREGAEVTRDIGYRAMAVFEPDNGKDVLCVATWAPRKAKDPGVLTTEDGVNFDFTPLLEDGKVNTFRSLVSFKGRLYIAPTGRFSNFGWDGKPCVSDFPVVLETSDPTSGDWVEASEYGFGDKTNLSIYELYAYNGFLYAGTFNPTSGAQLWKTDCEGKPPYKWKKILWNGAYRGNLNEMIMSMCGLDGDLFVGTGIQNGGFDYDNIIGPASAEIIRVRPDDSWELVVGEQRNTPEGHKSPLSGYDAGFNRIYNGYMWKMAEYNGYIYAGTLNWCSMLPFLDLSKLPYAKKMNVRRIGIDKMMENFAGCHLWRSKNGSEWEPVTQHGFGNPYNQGIRTLTSTPHGLFIGVSNPFGPEIASSTPDGWEYVPNPLGGLEIWQGHVRENERRKASTQFGGKRRADWSLYHWLNADYFGYSGFRCFGYWDIETKTQRQACFNLAEKLTDLVSLPEDATVFQLDSNEGGFTSFLASKYPGRKVQGWTFSYWKIERCRMNIEGAGFFGIDHDGTLPVEDGAAGALFAIEPAFYYRDRRVFIKEAARLIRAGGALAMFDIVDAAATERPSVKADDGISTVEEYMRLLSEAGLHVEYLKECTDATWARHAEYRMRYVDNLEASGHISFSTQSALKEDIDAGLASGRRAFIALLRKS